MAELGSGPGADTSALTTKRRDFLSERFHSEAPFVSVFRMPSTLLEASLISAADYFLMHATCAALSPGKEEVLEDEDGLSSPHHNGPSTEQQMLA